MLLGTVKTIFMIRAARISSIERGRTIIYKLQKLAGLGDRHSFSGLLGLKFDELQSQSTI